MIESNDQTQAIAVIDEMSLTDKRREALELAWKRHNQPVTDNIRKSAGIKRYYVHTLDFQTEELIERGDHTFLVRKRLNGDVAVVRDISRLLQSYENAVGRFRSTLVNVLSEADGHDSYRVGSYSKDTPEWYAALSACFEDQKRPVHEMIEDINKIDSIQHLLDKETVQQVLQNPPTVSEVYRASLREAIRRNRGIYIGKGGDMWESTMNYFLDKDLFVRTGHKSSRYAEGRMDIYNLTRLGIAVCQHLFGPIYDVEKSRVYSDLEARNESIFAFYARKNRWELLDQEWDKSLKEGEFDSEIKRCNFNDNVQEFKQLFFPHKTYVSSMALLDYVEVETGLPRSDLPLMVLNPNVLEGGRIVRLWWRDPNKPDAPFGMRIDRNGKLRFESEFASIMHSKPFSLDDKPDNYEANVKIEVMNSRTYNKAELEDFQEKMNILSIVADYVIAMLYDLDEE